MSEEAHIGLAHNMFLFFNTFTFEFRISLLSYFIKTLSNTKIFLMIHTFYMLNQWLPSVTLRQPVLVEY